MHYIARNLRLIYFRSTFLVFSHFNIFNGGLTSLSGYPVYHSMYDDFVWMEKFGDPMFHRHVAGTPCNSTSVQAVLKNPSITFGDGKKSGECNRVLMGPAQGVVHITDGYVDWVVIILPGSNRDRGFVAPEYDRNK